MIKRIPVMVHGCLPVNYCLVTTEVSVYYSGDIYCIIY